MKKFTNKVDRDVLVEVLKANVDKVASADDVLASTIKYTINKEDTDKKATKADLVKFVNQTVKLLGDTFNDITEQAEEQIALAPVAMLKSDEVKEEVAESETPDEEEPDEEESVVIAETKVIDEDTGETVSEKVITSDDIKTEEKPVKEKPVRPKFRGTKKKSAETPVKEVEEKPVEEVKTPAKEEKTATTGKKSKDNDKTGTEKSESKKPEKVKSSDVKSEKEIQLATMFPKTTEVILEDENGKYEQTFMLVKGERIKSMSDLAKITADGRFKVLIACYWTKRHLKQFPYFNGWLGQPKSFKNDLDMAQIIYTTEKICYAISTTTDAIYNVLPNDLEEVDGIRFMNGMEFQFYAAPANGEKRYLNK